MYHSTFIGRGHELAILQHEWEADQFTGPPPPTKNEEFCIIGIPQIVY
jgi:hypothetical protein